MSLGVFTKEIQNDKKKPVACSSKGANSWKNIILK
jgi:hypothetical protein